MKYLLDTHVILWAVGNPEQLPDKVRRLLDTTDHELFWSAASTWEIGIKLQTRRLTLPVSLTEFTARLLRTLRGLDIQHAHAARAAALPLHHRDPFDRMLVAQAQAEGLTLVTGDPAMKAYQVDLFW